MKCIWLKLQIRVGNQKVVATGLASRVVVCRAEARIVKLVHGKAVEAMAGASLEVGQNLKRSISGAVVSEEQLEVFQRIVLRFQALQQRVEPAFTVEGDHRQGDQWQGLYRQPGNR